MKNKALAALLLAGILFFPGCAARQGTAASATASSSQGNSSARLSSVRGGGTVSLTSAEVTAKLRKYLPAAAAGAMGKCSATVESGGETNYSWKMQSPGSSAIGELSVTYRNGDLSGYLFRASGFDSVKSTLTSEQVAALVKKFAEDFFRNGDSLQFSISSAAESGAPTETWAAFRDGREYIVLYNMNGGYIERAWTVETGV